MLFPTIIARPAAMVIEIEGLPLAGGAVREASLYARAGEPNLGQLSHYGERADRAPACS